MVKFSRISDEDMKSSLEKKYDLPENRINNLIHLSNGNYHKALEMMNSGEETAFFLDKFAWLMRLAFDNRISDLIKLVDELHELGREKLKRFFNYSLMMIRENFVLNYKHEEIVYLSSEERAFAERFHLYVHPKNTQDIYRLFNKASCDIESNAYSRIVLLDIGLQLNKILKKEHDFT
jgi:DNA polymerase-3 subunit delta'